MSDLWYFAYGSNLDKDRMERRGGTVGRHCRLWRPNGHCLPAGPTPSPTS